MASFGRMGKVAPLEAIERTPRSESALGVMTIASTIPDLTEPHAAGIVHPERLLVVDELGQTTRISNNASKVARKMAPNPIPTWRIKDLLPTKTTMRNFITVFDSVASRMAVPA